MKLQLRNNQRSSRIVAQKPHVFPRKSDSAVDDQQKGSRNAVKQNALEQREELEKHVLKPRPYMTKVFDIAGSCEYQLRRKNEDLRTHTKLLVA